MKTFKPFTSRRAENLANKMIDQIMEKIKVFNPHFRAEIRRDSEDFVKVVCYDKSCMTDNSIRYVMEVFNANLDHNNNTFYVLDTMPVLRDRNIGEDFSWKTVPSFEFYIKVTA